MTMTKIIAVVNGNSKNEWKILVNYVQRGTILHNINLANQEAVKISEKEHYDHLILAN